MKAVIENLPIGATVEITHGYYSGLKGEILKHPTPHTVRIKTPWGSTTNLSHKVTCEEIKLIEKL